jgi:hypothetical protein
MMISTDASLQEHIFCPPLVDVPCAWCLKEQGITAKEESHTICTRHAKEEYNKYRASRVVSQ